jgi:calcineurin-like phosphoesterase family protein
MNARIKILCVADEVDLLVYSNSIKERFGDVDLILSAGDLPDEYLSFIVSMLNKPMVSVAGNHDSPDRQNKHPLQGAGFLELAAGKDCSGTGRVSFSLRKESGLRILGIPGSMWYSGGPHQYTDRQMGFRLAKLIPGILLRRLFGLRGADIILAHSPPKGIQDGKDLPHRGFAAFPWLIKIARPYFFIHGHVHVYDSREAREASLAGTRIINVYGHKVVELPGDEAR